MPVLVGSDDRVAVGVEMPYIERIDRGDVLGEVAHVGCIGAGIAQVGVRLAVGVNVAYVGEYVQPLVCLIVGLQAGGETLEAGVLKHALLVQIAETGVVAELRVATADVHVVFLTEAMAVGSVFPVVGRDVVVYAVIVVGAAQRGIGIEFAVQSYQVLACGKGERIVLQSDRKS